MLKSIQNKINWSIKNKLSALMIMTLLLVIGCGVYIKISFHKVKVGGEGYQKIILYKDLVADILPPPENIIESYLKAFELLTVENSEEAQEIKNTMSRLEKQFKERHEYWQKNLNEGEIKTALIKESYPPAATFYKLYNEKFLPLIARREMDYARDLLCGEMREAYLKHQSGIIKSVKHANKLVEETANEVSSSVQERVRNLLIVTISFFIVLIVGFILINRSIISELNYVIGGLKNGLGKGSLSYRLTSNENTELGKISGVINTTADNLRNTVGGIFKNSENLDSSAKSLKYTSDTIAKQLKDASENIVNAKESTDTLSDNMNSVAGAVEEMTTTIKEISDRTHTAHEIANRANIEAREIQTSIEYLIKNSTEITQVVNTISTLAQQTNLLALNATIEASRAGDMGKGFAVVAQEVKDLALKTANSTENISNQIQTIQKNIKNTTEKMTKITDMVSEISENQSLIAAAIEEQTVTTAEIAKNISNVSSQGQSVKENIQMITGRIKETYQQSDVVSKEAAVLTEISNQLQQEVGKFSM